MSKMTKGLALLSLIMVAVAAVPATLADFHFALQRSVPAADATVTAPSAIQLWFTQVPQEGSLAIRLTDAAGELVETEEPEAMEDNAMAFTAKVGRPLSAGAYTVSWRGIGDDGHIVRDEFGFTVTSAAASRGRRSDR